MIQTLDEVLEYFVKRMPSREQDGSLLVAWLALHGFKILKVITNEETETIN